jgi:hypothetical protein
VANLICLQLPLMIPSTGQIQSFLPRWTGCVLLWWMKFWHSSGPWTTAPHTINKYVLRQFLLLNESYFKCLQASLSLELFERIITFTDINHQISLKYAGKLWDLSHRHAKQDPRVIVSYNLGPVWHFLIGWLLLGEHSTIPEDEGGRVGGRELQRSAWPHPSQQLIVGPMNFQVPFHWFNYFVHNDAIIR